LASINVSNTWNSWIIIHISKFKKWRAKQCYFKQNVGILIKNNVLISNDVINIKGLEEDYNWLFLSIIKQKIQKYSDFYATLKARRSWKRSLFVLNELSVNRNAALFGHQCPPGWNHLASKRVVQKRVSSCDLIFESKVERSSVTDEKVGQGSNSNSKLFKCFWSLQYLIDILVKYFNETKLTTKMKFEPNVQYFKLKFYALLKASCLPFPAYSLCFVISKACSILIVLA